MYYFWHIEPSQLPTHAPHTSGGTTRVSVSNTRPSLTLAHTYINFPLLLSNTTALYNSLSLNFLLTFLSQSEPTFRYDRSEQGE